MKSSWLFLIAASLSRFFRAHTWQAAVVGLLLTPYSTGAYALYCKGKITYLGLDPSGQVFVANGAALHAICGSTSQGGYTINPQACRMLYATLLAFRISGASVAIYYNDPNLTACSQIAPWTGQPSAYFVEQAD